MSKENVNVDEFLKDLSIEQKQFLEVNNSNALVSASAGSGKTFTMIKKLVYLLVYYDAQIEDLLVVTFTNAAGAELKQKLYNEMLKEINTTKNIDIDKNKLYEKLEKINACDIGTLHSICYKYILKYFYKCNIDPSSQILSEVDVNFLLDNAINKVIEDYSSDEEFYEIFDAYSGKRNLAKVFNIIKNLYYFVLSLPNTNDFKNLVVNNNLNSNLKTNICANYIFSATKNVFDEFEKEFKQLLVESSTLKLDNYSLSINEILNFISEYKKCNNFEEANKFIYNESSFSTIRPPRNMDGVSLDFTDRYKALKGIFTKKVSTIKTYYINEDISNILFMEEDVNRKVNKLFEIVNLVIEEYNAQKQLKNGLDYNDLEHFMLKILEDESVLGELRNKYKYIFVDEYQDINTMQEQILTKLSNGLNMYMIGDAKQSIYGFRLCTPDIFIEKYNTYKNKGKIGKSIELNKNYRSVDNILQFVNYVFSIIGTKNSFGMDYKENSMLLCGKEVTNNFALDNCVELNIINKDVVEEVEENDESEDQKKDVELEAKLIVNKVKEYLTKKYYNFNSKELEEINYKDIAILIRDKSDLLFKVYVELIENNIPVSAEIKLKLFNAYEVNLIISYLKLLSNINDDISLATVLRSNIVNLSDNDLAEIRSKYLGDTFLNAVINYSKNFDDEIAYKINKLFLELNNFRFELNSKTIKEIVVNIVTKYNLTNYFYSFQDGNQKLSNLEILINLVDNKNYENNLTKFLSYVEMLEDESYTTNVQSGNNFVTITTMHKSKGLDYPVVICANLGKSFSKNSLKQDAIITKDLGVGLQYFDLENRISYPTLSHVANKLNKELEEKREQLRLLYVALTRAKNYLCLVGSYNLEKIEKLTYKDILSCNSFIELILYSIIKNGHMNKLKGDKNTSIEICKDMPFNINFYTENDIQIEVSDNKLEIKPNKLFVDENIVLDLKRNFNFIYPYKKDKNIALKTSVTGLMESDYVDINEEPKELKINETKSNDLALKVGTIYHTVMEQIDYFKDNDVKDILDNVIKANFVTDEIKKLINESAIENAINIVKTLINKNTIILKEQQFILKDEHKKLVDESNDDTKVIVQGVIDLVLINDNIATIIDFKTNRTNNIDELKNKYSLQLKLYKLALEKAKNINVENCYLYSFYLNKLIKM